MLDNDKLDSIHSKVQAIAGAKTGLRILCLSLCEGDPAAARELYEYSLGRDKEDVWVITPERETSLRMQCLDSANGSIQLAHEMFAFVMGGDQ